MTAGKRNSRDGTEAGGRSGAAAYLHWFWNATAVQRLALLASMLTNLAGVALSLFFVYVCKTLIDIATGDSGRSLLPWSLILLCTMAAQTGASLLRTRLAAQTDIRVKNSLRLRLFSRLICVYQGGRGERHSGDITNRLEEDVRVISDCISNVLPALLAACLKFIAAFFFLLALGLWVFHKLQRNFIPVRTNCGTLTEQHRQPPIVFREGGMVMVLVIIHRIKIIPKQRKRYLVVHIHIGA